MTASDQAGSATPPKVCPECGHVFQGNGWDGIDAHWRAKHEDIMPYEEAWPLLKAGEYEALQNKETERQCQTCAYAHSDTFPYGRRTRQGYRCRRFPPQLSGDRSGPEFPEVKADEWCGEWEEA